MPCPVKMWASKNLSNHRSKLSFENGERPSRNLSHSPESQTAAQFEGGLWANEASMSTPEIRPAKSSTPSTPRSLSMRNVFRIGGQKKSLWLERPTAPVAPSKPEAVGGSPGSRTWSSAAPRPRTARSAYADFLSPAISPGEHGVAERAIRGTVLRGFSEDRIVHLPGGVQVR